MTRAHRFLGITLSAFVISGCTTSGFMSSQLWPWKEKDSARGLTADLTKPFPPAPEADVAQSPEFEFNHPAIDQQIVRFQGDLHGFYERALARSAKYVPVMGDILERNGLPRDLAYLPLIESGYEINAVSPAGAVGPWQFIRGTAVRYGLRVDRLIDERRDPIKATEAAARYLRDLYDMFNSWHLALAAYNTGEGNVGRILTSKGVEDYWSMRGKGWLYAETEAYVPKFLAALQIAKNPELFGFSPTDADPIAYDWVRVNKPLPLAKVAELSNTDINTLKQLNPALRRGSIPPSGYVVKLPKGAKQTYREAINQTDPTLAAWNPKSEGCDADDGVHCVRRGDTYASIAAQYNVAVRELLDTNRRRPSHRLRLGEALVIPGHTPNDQDDETAAVEEVAQPRPNSHTIRRGDTLGSIADRYGMSADELARINSDHNPRNLKVGEKLNLRAAAAPTAPASRAKASRDRVHTIAKNETPAGIAKRYGVSAAELLRFNGLKDSRGLRIGQRLRIPGGPATATAPTLPKARTSASAPLAAPLPATKATAAPMPKPSASRVHRVRGGDTPASIASRYGISAAELMKANNLRNAGGLKIDQALVIPSGKGSRKPTAAPSAAAPRTHVVGKGETPAAIAKRHKVTVEALLKANGIRDSRGLKPGQRLTVPTTDRAQASGTKTDS